MFLKVGEVQFANSKRVGGGTCGDEQPAVYLGKVYFDESVKSSIHPRALPSAAQKKNAPFVQRERHNAIIRDGEKRYRANGATSR